MQPLASVMMTLFTGFVAFTVGGLWDTQVHSVGGGHDDFAPPHLLLIGASLLFAAGGAVTLFVHRRSRMPDKTALSVTAWSAIGLFVSLWVVDQAWHTMFGLDQSAWSPPHLLCFISVFASLWGLLVVCRARAEVDAWHDAYVLGLGGAILVVALFAFSEHDLPGSTALATARPPWTYTAGGAFLFTTCLLLLRGTTQVTWGVTIPAVGAWLFFWLTGVGIEIASGLPYIEPPFPIWIPAVVLDSFFAKYEQGGLTNIAGRYCGPRL
jgi:hypothetical protein